MKKLIDIIVVPHACLKDIDVVRGSKGLIYINSIGSEDIVSYKIMKENFGTNVLLCNFDDVSDERINGAITKNIATAIATFAKTLISKGIKNIIVSCPAGLSRSAGVGAALMTWLKIDDSKLYSTKMPNALVKHMVLNELRTH